MVQQAIAMTQPKQKRKNVMLEPELGRKADVVAAFRGVSLTKLIEELIAKPITEEFDQWAQQAARDSHKKS